LATRDFIQGTEGRDMCDEHGVLVQKRLQRPKVVFHLVLRLHKHYPHEGRRELVADKMEVSTGQPPSVKRPNLFVFVIERDVIVVSPSVAYRRGHPPQRRDDGALRLCSLLLLPPRRTQVPPRD